MNGTVGSLWASCSANGDGRGVSLSIYGNQTTALFTGWEHSLRLLHANTEAEEFPGEPNIFAVEDEALIDAVRQHDPSRIICSYSEALVTLKVTLAANESMKTNRPVEIHN